jgi:uncharacterized protein (TIGR02246 family)
MTITQKPIFIGLLLMGLTACQSNPPALSIEDQDAITESSTKWVQTYNQNDWETLASLFTPDATMMPPNSPVVRGRDAIAAWETETESGFRIAFDIQEISGLGSLAYVRGRSCVFIPYGDGNFGVDVGKFLEIRKKQADGTWLIASDIFNSDAAMGSDLQTSCPFANLD